MSESWRKAPAESLITMLAAVAVSLVKDDPELIERFRDRLRRENCPIPADEVTEGSLSALNIALTLRGADELRPGMAGELMAEQGIEALHVPIPQIEDGAARSAVALGLGGFAVEFLHKHPDLFAQFVNWLNGTYPSSKGKEITADDMELADQLLTLMSAVANKVADQREAEHPDTVTVPDEAKGWRGV